MSQEKTCGGQDLAKGLAAGFVGGLVASWVMDNFQTMWSEVSSALQQARAQQQQAQAGAQSQGASSSGQGAGSENNQGQSSGQEQEPATVKAASALSQNIFHHQLTDPEKKLAGPAMHYLMGISTASLYGALSEYVPEVTTGGGLLWGSAVWLLSDELTVPALGFSKPPTRYPASSHIYALASHLVYGLTAELVRRIVRRAL